jgi:hypothetical protein
MKGQKPQQKPVKIFFPIFLEGFVH